MSRTIAVVCMGGAGHVQVLRPVIAGLARRGYDVRVLTRADYRATVAAAGGQFADLYAERPLDAADATSTPLPCRFVSFAAEYAASVAREIATFTPALIVYDTFTVVAPVAARMLDLPYVNVCPNHAPVPGRAGAALRADPRVRVSDACRRAVERLRREHGMHDASPFAYVETLSPFLNLYCEPPEFLPAEDHAAFAPVEFLGSLAPELAPPPPAPPPPPRRRPRVYVSFGTGVFRYFAPSALAALRAVGWALAGRDLDVVVSLGGHELAPAVRAALAAPNVRVERWVDQWTALAAADAFVTHHGLSSTHESIFHGVPMISYPFFGDQPALARRCQDLGLARALGDEPRAPIDPDALRAAITRATERRADFAPRLAEARGWELRTLARREAVLDRVLAATGAGA